MKAMLQTKIVLAGIGLVAAALFLLPNYASAWPWYDVGSYGGGYGDGGGYTTGWSGGGVCAPYVSCGYTAGWHDGYRVGFGDGYNAAQPSTSSEQNSDISVYGNNYGSITSEEGAQAGHNPYWGGSDEGGDSR